MCSSSARARSRFCFPRALCVQQTCGPNYMHPATQPYQTPLGLKVNPTSGTTADGIKLEEFPVMYNGYSYTGWIAYRHGAVALPQVLVIPNYAGLKQFDKDQAVFLAKCGFTGIAVDLYKVTTEYPLELRDPSWDANQETQRAHLKHAFQNVFYYMANTASLRDILATYLEFGRKHPAVHPEWAAAIGYCFGGSAVLEMVRGGLNVQAVVSFHGVLQYNPPKHIPKNEAPNNYNSKCKVLIESGDQDDFVTENSLKRFKHEMDEAGVDWKFDNHARTPHGFALGPGVYNNAYQELADRRSTLAMLSLFAETFPEVVQYEVQTNACGTTLGQHFKLVSKL